MKDAGVVNVCHAMRFPELPIGGNQFEDRFKIYLAGSGLLHGQLDEESQRDFRVNRNLGTYKGGLPPSMRTSWDFANMRHRNTAFTPAIDNVLVKGFDILSVHTDDDSMLLSDHRMLVCRLRANSAQREEVPCRAVP